MANAKNKNAKLRESKNESNINGLFKLYPPKPKNGTKKPAKGAKK